MTSTKFAIPKIDADAWQRRKTPSYPVIVVITMALLVVTAYLGLINYSLRQESEDLVIVTERTLENLNGSFYTCVKTRRSKNVKISGLEAAISKITKVKSEFEASAKDKETSHATEVKKAEREIKDLQANITKAMNKIDDLIAELHGHNTGYPLQDTSFMAFSGTAMVSSA